MLLVREHLVDEDASKGRKYSPSHGEPVRITPAFDYSSPGWMTRTKLRIESPSKRFNRCHFLPFFTCRRIDNVDACTYVFRSNPLTPIIFNTEKFPSDEIYLFVV